MISFIQQILQKHHKWIFSVLLGVIIVAFVFTIGATPGIVGKKKTQMFYGKNLLSKRDIQPVWNSVLISNASIGGYFYHQKQLNSAILARIALLAKADELLIPEADDKTLAKYIKTLPVMCDESGKFLQENYQNFVKFCVSSYGVTKRDVRQAFVDDQRISVLVDAITGNGYLSEQELESTLKPFYSHYDVLFSEVGGSVSEFDRLVSEGEARAFYEKHPGRYKTPDMFAVSIVRFNSGDLKAGVKPPSRETLEEFFKKSKEKFDAYKSFEEAYDAVVEEYRSLEASKLAVEQAENFVYRLYEKNIELNSSEFERLLKNFGTAKEKVAAYSRLKLPSLEGVPEAALRGVFDLDAARYYTDPVLTDFGAAVLIVEGRKDPKVLSFKEARTWVENDVLKERQKEQFRKYVESLKDALINCANEEAALEQFSARAIECQKFENISLCEEHKEVPEECWEILDDLFGKEKVGFVYNSDESKAFIAVILKLDIPPMAKMVEKDGGRFKNLLLMRNRNFELAEYVDELIKRGLE